MLVSYSVHSPYSFRLRGIPHMYRYRKEIQEMTPEEYYHMEDYIEIYPQDWDTLLLRKIEHLSWVLNCHRSGKIRTKTIQGLIPLESLYRCLELLIELEEYEHCQTVWDIILECYPVDMGKWTESKEFFKATI